MTNNPTISFFSFTAYLKTRTFGNEWKATKGVSSLAFPGQRNRAVITAGRRLPVGRARAGSPRLACGSRTAWSVNGMTQIPDSSDSSGQPAFYLHVETHNLPLSRGSPAAAAEPGPGAVRERRRVTVICHRVGAVFRMAL